MIHLFRRLTRLPVVSTKTRIHCIAKRRRPSWGRALLLSLATALTLLAGAPAALANLVTVNGVQVQTNMPQATRGA